ncbi:MAG TPA: MOSC domain-containing protein [Roseiflexaceae bacterium]|nr:MOSC domain-containing protein [Roseiflexaceae bacterium]
MITIHAIFTGQPQTMTDAKGTWKSSIFRSPVNGPIELGMRGLAGDQVTDAKNHGTPDQAVCCHFLDHYAFWNEAYGLTAPDALGPGSVGENWTLAGADEQDMCIGDVYSVGTARVQVTAPRYPCWKQDRKLKLPDFHKRTMATLRTGFYLRVLQPGVVQPGDELRLVERPQPDLTLQAVNADMHHTSDPAFAQRLLDAPELAAGWKRIIRSTMKD